MSLETGRVLNQEQGWDQRIYSQGEVRLSQEIYRSEEKYRSALQEERKEAQGTSNRGAAGFRGMGV